MLENTIRSNSGKLSSRFNALKHGILSTKALLNNEDPKFFAKFARKMMYELDPQGAIEFLLAERFITTSWRLRRLLDVERAVMEYEKEEKQGHDWIFEKGQEHGNKYLAREMVLNNFMDKIMRYETTLERSLYKTLDKLNQLKEVRNGEKTAGTLDIDSILRN